MGPVMNHNFRKPFPLRVYEWRIGEFLGDVTMMTSDKEFWPITIASLRLVVAFHKWLQGFLMNKMSFSTFLRW